MKRKSINFAKIGIFLILLLSIWNITFTVLKKPKSEDWDSSGFSYVYNNKDYYDTIFIGTSMVVTNINLEELYLNYGITGVTLGEPEQPTYLSYYNLLEALKYQNPKAVFFDVQSLFYTVDSITEKMRGNEHHHVHLSLDGMKNNETKYNAVEQARELVPELDYWNYFSSAYYSHNNWEDLTERNFTRASGKYIMNGNLVNFVTYENAERINDIYDIENDGKEEEIPDFNYKYLEKIIDLCKEKNVELVLLRGSEMLDWNWNRYNTIKRIADENQLQYFDTNILEKQIGFDWSVDSIDGNHHNISGARKWTNFIGDYLVGQYQFENIDNDESYFQQEKEKYECWIQGMETKKKLLNALDYEQYLKVLNECKDDDNIIFISVNSGEEEETRMLQMLLEKAEISGTVDSGSIAVVENFSVLKENEDDENKIEGKISQNIPYIFEVVDNVAKLNINNQDIEINDTGINIVVYNKNIQDTISKVYFDSSENNNPCTSRIVNGLRQYEESTNNWVTY